MTWYFVCCENLVFILLGRQNTIPNHIKVRTSNCSDYSPYYQTSSSVLWSFINIGLFRVLLFLHSKTHRVSHSRLNRDSSIKITCLRSCCSETLYSEAHFFRVARWLGVKGMQMIDLRAERSPRWNLLRVNLLDSHHHVTKCNSLCSWVALPVLFQLYVNSINQSSNDGSPYQVQRLAFPVSWNRFFSLPTTIEVTSSNTKV